MRKKEENVPRDIVTLPAYLPIGYNALGGLCYVLAVASLGAIAFILAQLRNRPRVYGPYFFLAALTASLVVDLTGAIYWEYATQIFLLVFFMLSTASLFELSIRHVHPSHIWTAIGTCVITLGYWVGTAFAMASASV